MYKILDKTSWIMVIVGLALVATSAFGIQKNMWGMDSFSFGFLTFLIGLGLGWLTTKEGRAVAPYQKALMIVGLCLFLSVFLAEQMDSATLGFLHSGHDASRTGIVVVFFGLILFVAGMILARVRAR